MAQPNYPLHAKYQLQITNHKHGNDAELLSHILQNLYLSSKSFTKRKQNNNIKIPKTTNPCNKQAIPLRTL